MSETPAKKPRHVLIWVGGGTIVGTCLGIITAFIIVAIDWADGEFPNGPPRWEVIERIFALEALYLGVIGALTGGIVGLLVGLYKWARWTKEFE